MEHSENDELNELRNEVKRTREDINAGMYGKTTSDAAGKIGAGCLILIIIAVLIFLFMFW